MLTKLYLLSTLLTLAVCSNPYCDFNETSVIYRTVTKTRQVVKKPKAWKFWEKKKVASEEYLDTQEHIARKLVTRCCEGYKMTAAKICEPICAQGCPEHAQCVEPNRCQCRKAYVPAISHKDGKHYCEPTCSSACPENARCIEPEECDCKVGYHAVGQKCVPYCSSGCPYEGVCVQPELCSCKPGYRSAIGTCEPVCEGGNGCANGNCTRPEECVCNEGFLMNPLTQICENEHCIDGAECAPAIDSFTTEEQLEEQPVSPTESEFDEHQKIFLSTPMDTTRYDASLEETTSACAIGYTYYNGECRPEVFASNEIDCRFKECAENAYCQLNGTCACMEGYIWYKPQKSYQTLEQDEEDVTQMPTEGSAAGSNEPVEASCISLAAFLKLNAAYAEDEGSDWFLAISSVLGIVTVLSCLIFLTIKLLQRQRGRLEVEGQHDLYCEYDNKSYGDNQMVC